VEGEGGKEKGELKRRGGTKSKMREKESQATGATGVTQGNYVIY
jgi:hypothetical protein